MVGSGALPTSKGLHRRIESISPLCRLCRREEEAEYHAIWGCDFTKGVWDVADIGSDWPRCSNAADLISWVLGEMQEEERAKFLMLAWEVWNERYAIANGAIPRDQTKIVAAAVSLLKVFCEAKKSATALRESPKQKREESRWCPPKDGMLKINVYGAVFGDAGTGMGVVIRDHSGEVVRAGCQQVEQRWSASIAEVKAMALGLKLAIQCNVKTVEVESDCDHF